MAARSCLRPEEAHVDWASVFFGFGHGVSFMVMRGRLVTDRAVF